MSSFEYSKNLRKLTFQLFMKYSKARTIYNRLALQLKKYNFTLI